MRLTIAIPTYDRPKLLAQTVAAILPQLTPECRLLVIDNCSPVPAVEVLVPIVQQYPSVDVRVVRHSVNVGGNSNILRCIELCETEWVWTLSDDEAVRPDAVALVLRTVREFPDCVYFNFPTGLPERSETRTATGCREFVRIIDVPRHLLLMSNNVYNARVCRDWLKVAQNYTFSNFQHLALALAAIGRDGRACLVRSPLIDGNADNTDNPGWSVVNVAVNRMTVLEMALDYDTRRELAAKILRDMPMDEAVTLSLAAQALQTGDTRNALFLYDAYCTRNYYFQWSWARALKNRAYRWVVRCPRLTRWLLGRFLPQKAAWFDHMVRYDPLPRT